MNLLKAARNTTLALSLATAACGNQELESELLSLRLENASLLGERDAFAAALEDCYVSQLREQRTSLQAETAKLQEKMDDTTCLLMGENGWSCSTSELADIQLTKSFPDNQVYCDGNNARAVVSAFEKEAGPDVNWSVYCDGQKMPAGPLERWSSATFTAPVHESPHFEKKFGEQTFQTVKRARDDADRKMSNHR